MKNPKIVVMGVSGSGKSLIGERLGELLGIPFHDADDYHSPSNIEKMANGIPLTDDDRQGWLADLAGLIHREQGLVLACSALKKVYRDRLRAGDPALGLFYLKGNFDTIWSRHSSREDHYFNGQAMLESQFQLLEEPGPDEATIIDIAAPPDDVLHQCLVALDRQP